MPDSNPHSWFAIRVKGNRDQVVSSALSGRGYETFLPTHKDPRSSAKPASSSRVCPFPSRRPTPGTGFGDSWGCVRFVGIGNSPRPIPDEEVESLRQVAKSGLPVKPEKYFAAGDKVRIESGPLAGTVVPYWTGRVVCSWSRFIFCSGRCPSACRPVGSPALPTIRREPRTNA